MHDFFRPELSKPLMGSPEICFGLPPNFSEESVKEANGLLVNAIVWGIFDSLFKKSHARVVMLLPADVTPSQRVLHVGMMIIRLKPDKRVYVVVG